MHNVTDATVYALFHNTTQPIPIAPYPLQKSDFSNIIKCKCVVECNHCDPTTKTKVLSIPEDDSFHDVATTIHSIDATIRAMRHGNKANIKHVRLLEVQNDIGVITSVTDQNPAYTSNKTLYQWKLEL